MKSMLLVQDPFDCNAALNNFFRATWCSKISKSRKMDFHNWKLEKNRFFPRMLFFIQVEACGMSEHRHGHRRRSTGAVPSRVKAAKVRVHQVLTLASAWFGSTCRLAGLVDELDA